MNKLEQLVSNIGQHPSVNNQFFELWTAKKLDSHALKSFMRNYWEWTHRFPEALASMMGAVDSYVVRAELAKTLFSELGHGDPQRIHSALFDEFCQQLDSKLENNGELHINTLRKNYDPLPETMALVNWEIDTYSSDYGAAIGGHLALEWQAYTMVRKLYEGARNYKDLWQDQDEFHEACEFFYVHIGEAEKEHKKESIIAAQDLIDSGISFKTIEQGFHQHLSLIENFWNAIADQILKS